MATWSLPAVVSEEGPGDWLAIFPDIPEAITGGESRAEALANAADALEEAVLAYLAEGRPLPASRRARAGETPVLLDSPTASQALRARGIEDVA